MHLDGIGILVVALVFLVVLVAAAGGASRLEWPNLSRHHERYPILDETTPEELPDDSAPSRDDD